MDRAGPDDTGQHQGAPANELVATARPTTVGGVMTTTSRAPRPWTIEAVRRLGVTTDVETAGAILGIGRSKAYELAKNNSFPVAVIKIGRRYVVPVLAILGLLGAAEDGSTIGDSRQSTARSQ